MPEEIAGRTVRQAMIALLQMETCTLRDVSQALHIPEKDVRGHLAHIRRSVSASRQMLHIHPAECRACGFVFHERQRFSRPGRCPHCKATRISLPRFSIRQRQD